MGINQGGIEMILEIPLWIVIVYLVLLGLVTIHLCIGDLLARIFYKMLKDKEKNNESDNDEH